MTKKALNSQVAQKSFSVEKLVNTHLILRGWMSTAVVLMKWHMIRMMEME